MNVRDEIKQALETGLRFEILKTPDQPYDIDHHEQEVAEELKHHIGNVGYSKLFLKQLGQLHGTGYIEINKDNNDELLFRQIEYHLDKSFYDHSYP
jgi:hypothetical protein